MQELYLFQVISSLFQGLFQKWLIRVEEGWLGSIQRTASWIH